MRLCDYHVHSRHSFDAKCTVTDMAAAAQRARLAEICVTDHLEFEYEPWNVPFDPYVLRAEVEAARPHTPVTLLWGAEIGLAPDPAPARQAWELIRAAQPDFIIGSVHVVGDSNVYEAPYFEGKTREEAYCRYFETILASLKTLPQLSVLGHWDFVAKGAPYDLKTPCWSDAPDVLDAIFRYLAENGKGMEINTGVWRGGFSWGLDALKRFAQLGGQFVTFGSDAHQPGRVGERLAEARELALAAGIRYTARFRQLQPTFERL